MSVKTHIKTSYRTSVEGRESLRGVTYGAEPHVERSPSGSFDVRRSTLDHARPRRFRFEKLEVWQAARKLNRDIYRLTRKFPADEQFALTSQVRRASVSISSNIAEGSGRNSDKDFAHFLEQAYGSLMEVASDLFLAMDEAYASEQEVEPLFEKIDRLSGQLAALNRSLAVKSSKVQIRQSRPD